MGDLILTWRATVSIAKAAASEDVSVPVKGLTRLRAGLFWKWSGFGSELQVKHGGGVRTAPSFAQIDITAPETYSLY